MVITPPVGKLFVELWDKTGRVRHSATEYSSSGPESFKGTTDEQGRLLHPLVGVRWFFRPQRAGICSYSQLCLEESGL